ncbi:MAG: DNA-directed RNA polymerase subunit alpha [Candidatus Falkowbacteria bacterium]
MEKIALPQKISFLPGEKPNQEYVVIEPCYPGFGITLGNSLRRVLLSSLPGAAVIGVKIEGADHEFMTLPHIKEDVLEIILNLKNLRLRVHSNEVIKLELDVHGEKTVTAKEFTPNAQVEIINSDLELAHITDMAGNLKMELYLQNGRGYETIESREKAIKHEIGYIETDSAYSPVLNVSVKVENVRVGKMTNWEKLVLEIITDGSIKVKDAFTDSVNVLISQFGSLIGNTTTAEVEDELVAEVEEAIILKEEDEEEEDDKKKRGRPKKSE